MIDVRCSHTENDKNERENSQANQSASEVQRHFGWLNNTSFSFSMGGGGVLARETLFRFWVACNNKVNVCRPSPLFSSHSLATTHTQFPTSYIFMSRLEIKIHQIINP